jgi:large subunit ribosomal protein L15
MQSAMFKADGRLGVRSCVSSSSVRCIAPLPFRAVRLNVTAMATAVPERLRLSNLSPTKGSRRLEKRKGRGHGAGQGGTCGFGNRGQKSRAGSGVRTGFEGGQTPLYRRLPKLKGIAGGMGAGLPKHVVVNLDDLERCFAANEEVTLEKIKEKVLSVSGRDRKLALKVLGTGTLSKPLVIKAGAFSEAAKVAIGAAGGTMEILKGRRKWTRKGHNFMVSAMKMRGLDYKVEKAKKDAIKKIAKGLGRKKKVKKTDAIKEKRAEAKKDKRVKKDKVVKA